METKIHILVVEDDEILSANLTAAIEDRGCAVVGPVASVTDALALLQRTEVSAAVLDANLLDRDVSPVALQLIELAIPFVIHTGFGLPDELAAVFPHVSVIMKPTDPDDVVVQLLTQADLLRNSGQRRPNDIVDAIDEPQAREAKIARIAAALFDQFNAKAITLARRQQADAIGEARTTWTGIIGELERLGSCG
ncbi:hypothetical protein Q4F19_11070 [Sphingomonas sp. BIUV-7]|uniref:Response regulatory domain-containing protein n=1 Tax=Sphingomonas natans TaxID=3063330 RepID=A0ABT8Y9B3_9SPHN|nr:hypothetical protein [Sphingomonas sp. BIUV-7]MDO6414923.1 hypothetical protein [Sphingomonas sp. BIUV-7]